ncbi:MAG: translocation/assembly module TamB domain-containing protein [Crocosphaera sp.]|nr:translocation/assembly module TamB domain-containing protein [Crocosphaera sp.]
MTTNPSRKEQHYELGTSQKTQLRKPYLTLCRWGVTVVLLGLSGGTVAGGFLIQRNLTPMVEKQLSHFLNRPVELGALQSFSFNYIRFGQTELLPTATDPANVSMSALKISYNPLQYIIYRQLDINITVITPSAYLEQGKQGSWLVTPFNKLNPNNPIKLKSLAIEKGKAIAVSRSSNGDKESPINLENVSAIIEMVHDKNEIKFKVLSKMIDGGDLAISGLFNIKDKGISLLVRGNKINATEIGQFLPLPLELNSGKVNANLEVYKASKELPQLRGVAQLHQVEAKVKTLPHAFFTQGQLRFQGTQINFDEVVTEFGEVKGIVRGNIDLDEGFDLTATTQAVPIIDIFKTIERKPPQLATTGKIKGDLKVVGSLDNPQILMSVINTEFMQFDRVYFSEIKGNLELNKSGLKINNFQATPKVGGTLIAKGNFNFDSYFPLYSLEIEGNNLPATSLASLYKIEIPNHIERVDTNINLSGNLKKNESLTAKGKAKFKLAGGTINAEHITYSNGNWQGTVMASNINLESLDLPFKKGKLQGQFQLTGNLEDKLIDSLVVDGQAKVTVDNGSIYANNIKLSEGDWHTNLEIERLNIEELKTTTDLQGELTGNFYLGGKLDKDNHNIQGKGEGTLNIGQGSIQTNNFQLNRGKWSTNLVTHNLNLTNLSHNIPQQLSGQLNSNLILTGNLDHNNFLDSLEGQGTGQLILSQGTINTDNITISQGNFTTTLTSKALPLGLLSPKLKGSVEGNLDIEGKINKISPKYLQAKGSLKLSQGLPQFDHPLTATMQWNGQRLTLDEVTASGLNAKGWLDIDFQSKKNKLDIIQEFDLNIDAKNFNLSNLPLSLPQLTYQGKLDFQGAMAGTPQNPNIEGQMALINLNVEDIRFEPVISGKITKKTETGLILHLDGQSDRLHLHLNPELQPLSIAVKQKNIDLRANKTDKQWKTEIKTIPLPIISKIAQKIYKNNQILTQPMSGNLSGLVTLDLETGAIAGQKVAILNPIIGTMQAKAFKGSFHYANKSLSLQNTQILTYNSQYDLNGQFTQTPQGPEIVANININQGKLQDILETLQIFELEDLKRGLKPPKYAKAADLYENNPSSSQTPLFKVETATKPLGHRMDTLKEITAWLEDKQKQAQGSESLPPLERVKGDFKAQIALNISPKTGINTQFNLLGKQWQWGDYQLTQLQAKGNWQNGILTLEPFNLRLKDSMINFAGQIGQTSQQGKLEVLNIPLETISQWVNLPSAVTLGGQLNGNVNLGGTRNNPQASGNLAVNHPTINQTALDSTKGKFTYNGGQFDFTASSVLDNRSDPLTIEGTFPYALPFAKVKPKSDQLSLKFQAKNEGLTLLNIMTQGKVAWLNGTGQVQLHLLGKVDPKRGIPYQLQADGLAEIKNATIATQMMPQNYFTQVQGKILFDLDTISFDEFSGEFSGGKVSVMGSLPLINSTDKESSLTVGIDNLYFNVDQLYQGGVNGFININGSVLAPKIGGQVNLYDGQVLLGEKRKKSQNNQNNPLLAVTELNALQIVLGDKIVINRPPILTFLATGNITLNGTLNKPQPEGEIQLRNGLVNLFASQLRLAGGKNNTAQFLPHKGFDPYLNLKLFTSATETNNNKAIVNPNSSEIPEVFSADKNSLETVRIKANVEGFASNITENIELSSQPKRNQKQIITLLGGTFLNTLGTGETTLGLVNLAGNAVLGPVQGAIGEALGLSEFRIFPTPLVDEDNAIDTSNIGVAAEAGVDVTDDFSLSIQTIVNGDSPPKLGIQYRINDSTTLRGSSNFSDDNRGSIQFEQRF